MFIISLIIIIIIIILLSSFKIVTIEIAGVLNRAGLFSAAINIYICFPINDNFAMTHTKNIPSCCDINNFASTLESKE